LHPAAGRIQPCLENFSFKKHEYHFVKSVILSKMPLQKVDFLTPTARQTQKTP
jgi:hypothetical protein